MNKVSVYMIVFLVLVGAINGAPSVGSYGGGAYGGSGLYGSGAAATVPPGIPPEIAMLIKSKLTSKVNTASVPAGPGGALIPVGLPMGVASLIKGLIDANTAMV